MGSKVKHVLKEVFLTAPAAVAILKAIGQSKVGLVEIVSQTTLSRQEVGAWLLDMGRHGVVDHKVTSGNGNEVLYYLTSQAVKVLEESGTEPSAPPNVIHQ